MVVVVVVGVWFFKTSRGLRPPVPLVAVIFCFIIFLVFYLY